MERAHEAAYVGVGERLELDPLDARQPRPLARPAAQRVAAVQVVGAVGRDQRRPVANGRVNRKLSRSRVDWSAQ